MQVTPFSDRPAAPLARRVPGRRHARLGLLALPALLAVLACLPAGAAASTPPAPPGPPPGNGAYLPAPPGTAPTVVPAGTPGAIPAAVTGPGLLGNTLYKLNKTTRTLVLPLACQRSGSARLTIRSVSNSSLARAAYTCSANRGTARLKVSVKALTSLKRHKLNSAYITVSENGATSKLYFSLTTGNGTTVAKGFWTDGHLQCTDATGAPNAYLVEPDFTTASTTPVSTRGWIAWYSAAGGWHWLGVSGENAGRWDTWTSSPMGIVQFHPDGAADPVPWTMGPISIPAGQGIVAVGVYEIVYWVGGKPDYQWQYVNAGPTGAAAAGAGNLYCSY
jgi:hypothetical protein